LIKWSAVLTLSTTEDILIEIDINMCNRSICQLSPGNPEVSSSSESSSDESTDDENVSEITKLIVIMSMKK